MMTMVVVFGGSGFLGRRLVHRLTAEGMTVRVAVRHPDLARVELRSIGLDRVTVVPADVRDQASVAAAIAGADAVVNAVSAYVEKAGVTFEAVHVQGAETLAQEAVAAGVAGSCLCQASAPIRFQALLISALEDAANGWFSRRFRKLRSFAQAPCSVRAMHCSARSPSSLECCQYCR
jgi:NAD(P)-dependent dehydrogenase (short-subunit alcohol dehydrogenase family)